MERLNPKTALAYWKVSTILLLTVAITSHISCKCFESQRLPKSHLRKICDILRKVAEHSIRASQDISPVLTFSDTAQAKANVDLVASLLTPQQVKAIANIDIDEMKEFISKQNEQAYQTLLQISIENNK